jgi:hypothetical protein
MGTKITKSNAESAIKDDKAHIDYLKRDVLDDQHAGGEYKDIDQTADEKHISKLAGDIKHDDSFLAKHWSHNRAFSHPSPHEGGPEMFSHDWGGESVEMKDQGSPLHMGPDSGSGSAEPAPEPSSTGIKKKFDTYVKGGKKHWSE